MAKNILDDHLSQEFFDDRHQRLRNYTIGVGILCLLGWIVMRLTILNLEFCSWSEKDNNYVFIEKNVSFYTEVGFWYFYSYCYVLYSILTNTIKELNPIRITTAIKEFFEEAKNNSSVVNFLLLLVIITLLILVGVGSVASISFFAYGIAALVTDAFHMVFFQNQAPFILQDTTFISTLYCISYLIYSFLKKTNTFKNYGDEL